MTRTRARQRVTPSTRLEFVKDAPNLVKTRTAFLSLSPTDRTHRHFLIVGYAIMLELVNPANYLGKVYRSRPVAAQRSLGGAFVTVNRTTREGDDSLILTQDLRLPYLDATSEDGALKLPQLTTANGGMDVDTAQAWLKAIQKRFSSRIYSE